MRVKVFHNLYRGIIEDEINEWLDHEEKHKIDPVYKIHIHHMSYGSFTQNEGEGFAVVTYDELTEPFKINLKDRSGDAE